MSGPLDGVRVLEFAAMGPTPFAVMMLSDMGAEVVRVDRLGAVRPAGPVPNPLPNPFRGRRSVAMDLKHPAAVAAILRLAEQADVLVEGFRPGTMERLGLGPDTCAAVNPRLVYARVTGWGQDGPYARLAGHDINYISVAGALDPIGRAGGPPVPPVNLVGDYGGGGMFAAFGVACALFEARQSGEGQVVDAAMTDGAAVLTTSLHWLRAAGTWNQARGTNRLDSGAHFYDVYETADGRYVSIGSIEPRFYAELRRALGLADPKWDRQDDPAAWPVLKADLAAIFRTRNARAVVPRLRRGEGRRVLRPGALTGRGAGGPAQRGPRRVPDQGRSYLPRARPEAVAHPRRRGVAAAGARPGHDRGPAGLGLRC